MCKDCDDRATGAAERAREAAELAMRDPSIVQTAVFHRGDRAVRRTGAARDGHSYAPEWSAHAMLWQECRRRVRPWQGRAAAGMSGVVITAKPLATT